MAWGYTAVAGAMLVGSAISADGQRRAGDRAAEAQGGMAQAQLEEQRRTRAAATSAAAPSPQEIQSLQQMITTNNADIARKQKLLDSADPALIEAGHQALDLLQGKEATVMGPMRAEQARQRAKLEDTLRAKLGAGYDTSTAGIQALATFDQQSQLALQGAQQNTLASLLGVTQGTESQGNLSQNMGIQGAITNIYGNQSNRMVSAINQTPITMAGAPFVGDLFSAVNAGQTARNTGNLISQAGTLAGMYIGGAPSSASPTSSPTGGGDVGGGGLNAFGGDTTFKYK